MAVFVAMHTANESVLFAFHQTVDRIAGAAQLQVTSGETGFDEDVLRRVQAQPEVRAAAPVIEAVAALAGQGNILFLGVDIADDHGIRSYDVEGAGGEIIENPLEFLAEPDSIIITDTLARESHLKVGSKVAMSTMQGEKWFTVRGIMRAGGMASAFGGNLAVMDIYAAQNVFGRGRKFDRVDVALRDGVSAAEGKSALSRALGPGFQVGLPAARAQQFEAMSRAYAISADITSAFALFIGMFIIYNTFQIAVTQRRAEIGILRALGASRRRIQAVFLMEGAIAGLIGSMAGAGAGVVMARGMSNYISGLLGDVYGVPQKAGEIATNPWLIAAAIALGILSSIVAAWIPSRDAARVEPVNALQKGKYQQFGAGENRMRRSLAAILAALSLVLILFPRERLLFYASDAISVLALLLLTPTLAMLVARALRPGLKRLRPVEGTLAADSLLQAPRRTSGAVAALMLSLALVVALGGLARASYDSIGTWMNTALNPDLFVTPSQSLTTRTFRFPPLMAGELRAIPGVDEAQAVRDARVPIHGSPVMMVAVDLRSLARRVHIAPVAGDPATMYEATAQGKGVLVSENFSILHGYKLGDVVDIPAPDGDLRLPVVGISVDYSDQQGAILIDRGVYLRHWKDATVDLFRVYLRPGASEADVKRAILDRFAQNRRLFVLSNREVRAYILKLTDQWFGITYIQIAVAVLVAILGIVNTLTVSITDRRRELGLLQAVGGMRDQIRRTIWLEALTIGMVGTVLGLGAGAVQLYYSLGISERDVAGLRLPYEFPWQIAGWLLPIILAAALIAALGPAESAVRGSLVEALEYE